jgi:hypothetical protein
MSGGPTGINATALRQWLQTWLKPWAFSDIEFADIAGAQTDGNGDLIVAVITDGTTIVGDGTSGAPIALVTPVTVADGGTGTATPGLIAGAGIAITGPWPDQTISATGTGAAAKGVQAITAGAWNQAVALGPTPHTVVMATPNWNTTVYVTGDSSAGFTLNFGTSCPPGGGSVMWMVL